MGDLGVRHLLAVLRVRHLIGRSRPAPRTACCVFEKVASALGAAARVQLRVISDIISPFVAHTLPMKRLGAVLVLPEQMTEEGYEDDLPAVLAHGVTHLKSRDMGWAALAKWLNILGWFHPLVWLISAAHAAACERVCDAVATEYVGGVKTYPRSLARAALAFAAHTTTPGALSMFRKARIIRRLRPVEQGIQSAPLARIRTALAVVVLAVLLAALGGVKAARAQREAMTTPETAGKHFLFMRRDAINGPTTLVLAEARPDGLDLSEVATGDLKGEALCAVDGKVYMLAYNGLYAIDLATGEHRPIPSFVRYGPYCFDSDRLYSIVRGTNAATLRLYDFAKGAYRDVMKLPAWRDCRIAVSPDHRRLAYYRTIAPRLMHGFMLVVVDLNTRTSREVGPAIEYCQTAPLDARFEYPPFVWLDPETLLVARMSRPTAQGSIEGPNVLTTVNVLTNDTRDVLTLPGRPMMDPVKLHPPAWDGSAHVEVGFDRYRIDMERGRLVEDDSVGELFNRIAEEDGVEILHGNKRVDFVQQWTGRHYQHVTGLLVSPEGQRVLWGIINPTRPPYKLKYYDAREEKVQVVTDTWEGDWALWVNAEDLEAPPQEPAIPNGWTALFTAEEISTPEAEQERVDPRKRIQDFVKFTMTSDKERYRLHEPVVLTLSVTNVSDTDIEVRPPYPDDRIVEATLESATGGGSRFFGGTSILPYTLGRVILKAGDTISETGTLEFSTPSSYRITGRYRNGPGWLGSCQATVEFDIEVSPGNDSLLEEKLDRLVTRLREECANEMTWTGSHGSTSPQIEHILKNIEDIGAVAVPYLIDTIRSEDDERLVSKLYRPLIDKESPSAFPLYEERIADGTTAEKILICSGLRALRWHRSLGDKALGLLASALEDQNPSVRYEAARHLRRERHALVKAAFEKALRDSDPRVRETAAWYLARAEDLDLAEWLGWAAEEPTRARYMAAHLIIPQLEKQWHEQKGRLPAADWDTATHNPGMLEQFRQTVRAWAEWAQENPRFSSDFF